MNVPAARIGIYVLLSVLALAAVAGGMALSRRSEATLNAGESCWAASAG